MKNIIKHHWTRDRHLVVASIVCLAIALALLAYMIISNGGM